MNDKQSSAKLAGKIPYLKPKLRTIELVAEEVLGVGCKSSGAIAVGVAPCWGNGCAQNGS